MTSAARPRWLGSGTPSPIVSFGRFRLDRRRGRLLRDGRPVSLPHQAVQLLGLLVDRPGELITREALQQRLWPDRCVEYDQSLNSAVRMVRRVLDDDPADPTYIATVPRRGYRFIAPVRTSHGSRPVRAVAVAVLVGLVGLAWVGMPRLGREPPPSMERQRLLVLPFEDYSAAGQGRYLADGLTEDLIASLARMAPAELGVIARTSAMTYRGTTKTAGTIGRELDVDFLVEGSARIDGDAARVVVQLIRTDDGEHVWAQGYDVALDEAVDLRRRIATDLSQSLHLNLDGPPSGTRMPVGSRAYRHYLEARAAYLRGGLENIEQAVGHYRQAIERSPAFARAHNGLGQALLYADGPPAERIPAARAAVDRALALDPGLTEAYVDRARIALFFDRDWALARRLLDRAREMDPNDVRLLKVSGYLEVTLGRFDEGLAYMQRAVERDPLDAGLNAQVGLFFMKAGDLATAERQCTLALELGSAQQPARRCLIHTHLLANDFEAAWAQARQILVGDGVQPGELAAVQNPRVGLEAYWEHLIQRYHDLERSRYVSPYWFAIFHAQLGEVDRAVGYLQRMLDEGGAPNLVFLDVDPRYRNLWGDPGFMQLRDEVFHRQRSLTDASR